MLVGLYECLFKAVYAVTSSQTFLGPCFKSLTAQCPKPQQDSTFQYNFSSTLTSSD